ncbi:MAG: phosphopantothenoylcysteine decarboxylase [Candidatus Omnitrophota bacterium]|nr:phosphopantothenoylcysteine decarboxylase [Candidatus Omnitrophota bacterium]
MKIKNILITAGPTRERIDPVRYISNYSTGTFGYKMAREAKQRGLSVTLVSGPTLLEAPMGVKLISVESARDMRRAVLASLKKADCVIMTAAVADWRCKYSAKRKMKKGAAKNIELVENTDILAEVGRLKKKKIAVGFALETENLEKNALKKLKDKKLDLIVANRLTQKRNIFGDKRLDVVTIDKFGNREKIVNKTKSRLAKIILDKALKFRIN